MLCFFSSVSQIFKYFLTETVHECFRIVDLCESNPKGVSNAVMNSGMADVEPALRVNAINQLLSKVTSLARQFGLYSTLTLNLDVAVRWSF
jgi:hypothetical protein